MNGINRRAIAKLAGTLGLAGASSLLAFPAFSASPSLSKVNPNPTIFSEAPYNRIAQASGSGATTNLDRNGTPGGAGSAAPSGTPTNPSGAPTAEPSNVGPTQNRSTTPGSSNGSSSPSAAPSGTPTNPSAAPSGSGGSGADVVVPSSGGSSMPGGMSMPTPAQGGSISPAGGNPTDSTTTPSSIPGTPGNMTTPSTTTPGSTTMPSSTPDSTTTTPSSTPDSTTTTPDSTTTTPDSTTTTPSSTPRRGNGGVRALW